MKFQLQYRPYQRRLKRPIRFGMALWDVRSGLIVRVEDEAGRVGFGEIAPLEAFGSESVERAQWLLRGHCGLLTTDQVEAMDPVEFPCTTYALDCAMKGALGQDNGADNLWVGTAALLQSEDIAILEATHLQGIPELVIKLKVGGGNQVEEEELARVRRVVDQCRVWGKRLRLDANEQFTLEQARRWLDALSDGGDVIEFLEQPLERWCLDELMEIAQDSPIRIALDESVQLLHGPDVCRVDVSLFDWVIKPSLGDLHWAKRHAIPEQRQVFSSVFETAIGFAQLLRLAPFARVGGLDTQDACEDELGYPKVSGGFVTGLDRGQDVWQQIG